MRIDWSIVEMRMKREEMWGFCLWFMEVDRPEIKDVAVIVKPRYVCRLVPLWWWKPKKATPIGCSLNLVDLIEVLYQPSPCWNGIYRDLNMILSFDRRTSAAKLSFNGPCRGRYVKASLLQNWRSINKRVQCSLLGNMQQWKSQHLALQLILIKL